ncbi:MAG: LLM class flavin-dependent oxidoreductase [Actinomycetia bacterium]|nr:LLM class flavin-dependent oxidoreductase [Actinomycetes bacterium]
MPVAEVVALAREAERIGYDYLLLADEGFMPDVYACLAVIARETETIALGAMTNGYTRHPAVTAAATATLNELSGGRSLVIMLAGGSMVLGPMGIARRHPFRVVSESIEVMRQLWTGGSVTWEGAGFSLDQAQLGLGPQSIPIWVASRGPILLGHAGAHADGVVMTVKPDLGDAIAIVDTAASEAGRTSPVRAYLGRICYSPDLVEGQRRTLSFVLMDSPPRVLRSLGFDDDQVAMVETAAATNRPELITPMVTTDLLHRYQVAGSPDQCAVELANLVDEHRLDVVLVDVVSPDLDENLSTLHQSHSIINGQTPTTTGSST